jgi:CRISPR-associated endonuclease Csn1
MYLKGEKNDVLNYLTNVVNLKNPKIIIEKLKINTLVESNGTRACITGRTNNEYFLKNTFEANFSYDEIKIIRKITKAYQKFSSLNGIKEGKIVNDFSELNNIIDNKYIISPAKNENTKEISITLDECKQLYETMLKKLDAKIYKYSPIKGLYNKLITEEYLNKINGLNLFDYIIFLNQLLSIVKCDRTTSDLRVIGLSKDTGVLKMNSKIQSSLKIIYQSITGYYSKIIWSNE